MHFNPKKKVVLIVSFIIVMLFSTAVNAGILDVFDNNTIGFSNTQIEVGGAGQAPASAAVQAPVVTNDDKPQLTFFQLFIKGGYILIPIVLLSLISVYLIIQKWMMMNKSAEISNSLLSSYKQSLRNGDISGAKNTLASSDSAFAMIMSKGVSRIGFPAQEIESAMESSANIEISKMTRNVNYLGVIAGVAPMLGFVGTITGIIKIFYSISISDNISIGIISEGLYEKMISSGSGLVVGLIAYAGYHVINIRIENFMAKVEEESQEFMDIIQNVES